MQVVVTWFADIGGVLCDRFIISIHIGKIGVQRAKILFAFIALYLIVPIADSAPAFHDFAEFFHHALLARVSGNSLPIFCRKCFTCVLTVSTSTNNSLAISLRDILNIRQINTLRSCGVNPNGFWRLICEAFIFPPFEDVAAE